MALDQRLHVWKGCYEKLLEIAEAQRHIINSQTDDLSPFASLSEQWLVHQAEADQRLQELEAELGKQQVSLYYREHIHSIARQIDAVIKDTESQLRSQFGITGEVIKETRDRRKLMNAYYGMNQDDGIAYYVDEKK